jgi:hypothetical protein
MLDSSGYASYGREKEHDDRSMINEGVALVMVRKQQTF